MPSRLSLVAALSLVIASSAACAGAPPPACKCVDEKYEARLRERIRHELEVEADARARRGQPVAFVQENRVSQLLRLVRAAYAIDGKVVQARGPNDRSLAREPEFAIYSGDLSLGEHVLAVQLEYEPYDPPPFGYDEPIVIKNQFKFRITDNAASRHLRVVLWEQSAPPGPLSERLALKYIERADSSP